MIVGVEIMCYIHPDREEWRRPVLLVFLFNYLQSSDREQAIERRQTSKGQGLIAQYCCLWLQIGYRVTEESLLSNISLPSVDRFSFTMMTPDP